MRSLLRRLVAGRRLGRCRGVLGQATVEFALVSLTFIPLVLGAIEVGRGVWYYNQLSQLSREGARWLIVTTADDHFTASEFNQTGNTPGTYTLGACGCGANTAVGWMAQKNVGLPADRVTVTIQRDAIGTYTWGMPVTVTVRYPYQPIIPGFLNIPATINLRAATTMHMQ
jgi:Flp pilus assembly protein TadG